MSRKEIVGFWLICLLIGTCAAEAVYWAWGHVLPMIAAAAYAALGLFGLAMAVVIVDPEREVKWP